MMKMRTASVFKLDLKQIEGEGDFPCPSCGNTISPDDLSEESYKILEVKSKGDRLEGLTILCNKCGSIIHLVGFELLNEYEEEFSTDP